MSYLQLPGELDSSHGGLQYDISQSDAHHESVVDIDLHEGHEDAEQQQYGSHPSISSSSNSVGGADSYGNAKGDIPASSITALSRSMEASMGASISAATTSNGSTASSTNYHPNGSGGVRSGGNARVLISRPPTRARDSRYSLAFIFVVLSGLIGSTLLPEHETAESEAAEDWAPMVMLACILGSSFGAAFVWTMHQSASDLREQLWALCLSWSIIAQAIVALLIALSGKLLLAAIVIGCSAVYDATTRKAAHDNITISTALVQLLNDINMAFGPSIYAATALIIAVQCCLFLWWGAVFVTAMSTTSSSLYMLFFIIYAFSLYWISQVCHNLLGAVVSGCVLWYFADGGSDGLGIGLDESESASGGGMQNDGIATSVSKTARNRTLLYMRCAISSSFGSICKLSLFAPFSHLVLAAMHWARECDAYGYQINSRWRRLTLDVFISFESWALQNNWLSIGYVTIYGYSASKAAEEMRRFEIIKLVLDDSTNTILKSMVSISASVVTVLAYSVSHAGAMNTDTHQWVLFVSTCYFLAYTGASLVLHAYRCGVVACVIAHADSPARFEAAHPILYHRFTRTSSGLPSHATL